MKDKPQETFCKVIVPNSSRSDNLLGTRCRDLKQINASLLMHHSSTAHKNREAAQRAKLQEKCSRTALVVSHAVPSLADCQLRYLPTGSPGWRMCRQKNTVGVEYVTAVHKVFPSSSPTLKMLEPVIFGGLGGAPK